MFKVLVVDDDPNVRLFLERLLSKKFSCTVETAKDGADALSKLKEFDAEVMLLDITMPVMDGVETLTALRQDNNYNNLEVIVLTAVSEKETVAKVMSMGVVDYMLKPLLYEQTYLRLKELFEIIRKRIQKRKLMKTAEETDDAKIDPSVEKFLLVLSDEELRLNLKENLTKLGFYVIDTDNGAEGLKLFVKFKPNKIIVGENLHLLNEMLFAQKIKTFRSNMPKLEMYYVKHDLNEINETQKKLFDFIISKDKVISLFKKN